MAVSRTVPSVIIILFRRNGGTRGILCGSLWVLQGKLYWGYETHYVPAHAYVTLSTLPEPVVLSYVVMVLRANAGLGSGAYY